MPEMNQMAPPPLFFDQPPPVMQNPAFS